ncbi:ImmA/IrrE family metallo-endopeptidase [Alloscardovia theropitheci]|uniref:ImmA/IrrE family metallo-endopeptidase n=1 Tax=Alloscardovia theropitheci TaxID=2496842 RepID=A0A4R0QRR4_9BIFI|nr:ImmA/IrrE family metallo-endopeptidase [Alloscardovia theropitheci]TCD53745.1 ImmA/IrrE family metallo-endopeptidase [Alloscardovia theropitheci]
MNSFNLESLILLQQLEKVTKNDIATWGGVSLPTLSKILNRQKEAPDSLFERVSDNSGYPLEFFQRDTSIPPAYELTYRHTSRTTIQELNAIAAEYSLLSDVADTLAGKMNIKSKAGWIDQIAPKTESITHADIERLASLARQYMNLPAHGAVSNVTRALERCGIVVAPLHALTPDDADTKLSSDGVTHPLSNDELLSIGFKEDSNAGDRDRFTKAHELGHLILHKYRRLERYSEMEREAHAFAGAFLMPEDDAKTLINPNIMLSDFLQLKASWGISIAALISRGYDMNILSRDRWRSLYMQLSARGWRKTEPITVVKEKPLLLQQILQKEYGDKNGFIDSFTAEHELGIRFGYLDVWAGGLIEQGSELGYRARRF